MKRNCCLSIFLLFVVFAAKGQVYTEEVTVQENLGGKVSVGSPADNADLNVNGNIQVDGKTIFSDPQVLSLNVSYTSGQWLDLSSAFATGTYLCQIKDFQSAGKGGNIWHYYSSFLMTWYDSTNGPDAFAITNSPAAHAMNGSTINFRIQNVWGHNPPKLQMQVNGESATNVSFELHYIKVF